ncbi:hypothetical protein EMCRGX_G032789 [Ephydatia muelleri]
MPRPLDEEMKLNRGQRPYRHSGATKKANGVGAVTSSAKMTSTRYSYTALKLTACNIAGIIFGIAAEKGKVYVPAVIRGQMLFRQFTMMKVFLSAVSAGSCCFVVLAALPQTRKLFHCVQEDFASDVNGRQISAFLIGGGILGVGMTLAGACPGMVTLQVFTGMNNAWMVLAGCFLGAFLYGLVDPWVTANMSYKTPKTSREVWLHSRLGLPFIPTATTFALMFGGATALVEYLYPWQNEAVVSGAIGYLSQSTWSPIVAGLLMGCMQIPVFPTSKKFYSGINNWWQVIFWAGAGLGAALSAYQSSSWGTLHNSTPLVCLVGGACMVFGARFAQGCTSGHGLSGMALLSLPSFAAVCAMFAGGIGTSLLLQSFHYEL